MQLRSNRTRLVTFRISAEEHHSLTNACATEGARSVSDYARSAVLARMMIHRASNFSLGDDLATLGTRLEEIDHALQELSQTIARVMGKRSGNEPSGENRRAQTELKQEAYK
jgi:hypothetical protein